MTQHTITIPRYANHNGLFAITITVEWNCIYCGAERGEPYKTVSYDGSCRLEVDGWINPCGHIEKYSDVRNHYNSQLVQGGAQ